MSVSKKREKSATPEPNETRRPDLSQVAPLDPDSYVPLYVQLADRLGNLIRSRQFAAGDLLPSEAECEKHFRVSRLTVRQAMQKLTHEGLIVRELGRGTFVAPVKVDHDIAVSFEEEMHASNLPIDVRLIDWKQVQPSADVAAALKLKRRQVIYRLERLRLVAGKPIGREIRHFPAAIGAKIEIEQLRSEPVSKLLQQVTGKAIRRIAYRVSVVSASAHDAALLLSKKGSPLLSREHVYFGDDDMPLLHGVALFLGEAYSFHFECGAGQIRMGSHFDWQLDEGSAPLSEGERK